MGTYSSMVIREAYLEERLEQSPHEGRAIKARGETHEDEGRVLQLPDRHALATFEGQ